MSGPIAPASAADVLIAVDVQNDFCPGGALPVPRGDEVFPAINRLTRRFRHVLLTQDWHPADHQSFASVHGRRPYETCACPTASRCCGRTTASRAQPARPCAPTWTRLTPSSSCARAATHGSTPIRPFFENDRTTSIGLGGYLRERRFRRLFLAGLALDFCVLWSAEDACRLGFDVVVLEDACRAIDLNGSAARARSRLAGIGIRSARVEEIGEP